MALPHKISTLLYCFNAADDVLLMNRAQEPNRGLWSPPGGKLKTELGESPYACACREADEELQLKIAPTDLHLTGIVSESGYQEQGHWLMFLFEVKPRMMSLPPPHREGSFQFFARDQLETIEMPSTDARQIWPLFWRHRGGFFAAYCQCGAGEADCWTVEESHPSC